MNDLHATSRLLWRPASVLILLAMGLVFGIAVAGLPDSAFTPGGIDALGPESEPVRETMWRLATLLPAAAGMLLNFLLRELQHTTFAWTLPDLERRLLLGQWIIGSAVALAISALAASVFGPHIAVAVFGWSVLAFVLGGVSFDPALSKLQSQGVPLVIAAIAFRPLLMDPIFSQLMPAAIGVLGVAIAFLVLRHQFSREQSRKRPLDPAAGVWTSAPVNTRLYWSRHTGPAREARLNLASDSLVEWMRAGVYEGFGGHKFPFMQLTLMQMALVTVIAHFTVNFQMVVVMPWIFVVMSSAQLRTTFLYPITRDRRASLFFLSTLFETAVVVSLATIALTVLWTIRPDSAAEPLAAASLDELLLPLSFFAAFAPIGHWAKIRGPWTENGSVSGANGLRFFAYQIAFLLAGVGTHIAFEKSGGPRGAVFAAIALCTATHTVYWFALRRHFTHADLVVPR